MKQLGDITKIDGHLIEPVDVITFGSPCQDLSIAGKRAGLEGERSGLFMEAVRIIKEMREETNGRYPTFAVWENVPGAFSSNNGGDFQCVVEEMCRIADNRVTIPRSDSGRWLTAGTVVGGNYSIAWRVMDAQYWGVPQRRRRIALVADFGGQRAGKILFESKSVRWNPPSGEKARKSAAAGTTGSTGTAVTLRMRSGCAGGGKDPLIQEEKSGTLGCNNDQTLFEKCLTVYPKVARSLTARNDGSPCVDRGPEIVVQQCAGFSGGQSAKAGGIGYESDRAPTLRAAGSGSNHAPCICIAGNVVDRNAAQNGSGVKEDVCFTLNTVDRHAICLSTGQANAEMLYEQSPTLNCNHEQQICVLPDVTSTLCASAAGLSRPDGQGNETDMCIVNLVRRGYIVRRLTPLECERLQGYPDGWTDIPGASDSARYKALGNSIALPQWDYVLRGISKYLPPRAKLGSLFDGIGGFTLTWERIQGVGTARWASEIEKFPMEVTAIRFREEKDDTAEKPAEPDSRDAQ